MNDLLYSAIAMIIAITVTFAIAFGTAFFM